MTFSINGNMKCGNIDEDGNALMAGEWWLMTRNSDPVTVGTHVRLVASYTMALERGIWLQGCGKKS
jgi:hypothetical protein